MPISVMPTCTVERKLVGSSASFSARSAPRLPAFAIASSRARRAETIASSDMAKKPFSTTSTRTITIGQSIGLPGGPSGGPGIIHRRRPARNAPPVGVPRNVGATPRGQVSRRCGRRPGG